ncbi:SRPBCC family protein [Arthrobacter sp.]|uniref:SRPBCC family protein n=1 Tax=Arthrobacter sp. TaxID=1667 RepID=UPI003A91B026
MAVSFTCTTCSTLSREALFELDRDIDVHTASLAHSRERAVAGVAHGPIQLGQEVTWRAWHFGVPLRMTSRITQMDAPHRFVDEQVKGPFASFRHVHDFDSSAGVTTMTDHVEFTAPCGLVGRIVEKLVLARYLRRLIETRNRHLVGTTRA